MKDQHFQTTNVRKLSFITLTYRRFEVMDPIRGHVYNKPEEDNRVTEKPHDELST